MRVVIKVGTNILSAGTQGIHRPRLIDLARQIACLNDDRHELILVSSGAIFAGRELLGLSPTSQKRDVPHKQMLAAVGQGHLLALYQQIFQMYNLTVAQALLTRADLAKVGDNDNLSALVANLIEADLLIILTDQPGLFTTDPRQDRNAQLVASVTTIDEQIWAMAGSSSGDIGTGGMITKIEAAELATRSGVEVIIAAGHDSNTIIRVVNGEPLGTRFATQSSRVESRKRWILAEEVQGAVVVDDGAAHALLNQNKSLLVVGVTRVVGDFERGAIIRVLNAGGQEIGRGLAHYNAADLQAICGKRSHQIAQILGFDYGPTAVHRDNLVMV
jgi:glutamate 5-kinase